MSTPWSSRPTGTGCAPLPLRASRSSTWRASESWVLQCDNCFERKRHVANMMTFLCATGRSSTSSSPTRFLTTTPRAPRPSRSPGPLTVRPSLPVFPTTPSESGPSYNCEAAHEVYRQARRRRWDGKGKMMMTRREKRRGSIVSLFLLCNRFQERR